MTAFALLVSLALAPARGGADCAALGEAAIGSGSFTIRGADGERELRFSSETQLVFCRQTAATMTWIRLAESRDDDGGSGPHLDIDICALADGGAFRPMNARANPCPGGQTWAVWWHASATRSFATHPSSSPCELEVTVEPSRVIGTFACHGLTDAEGSERVDVLEGRFEFASAR